MIYLRYRFFSRMVDTASINIGFNSVFICITNIPFQLFDQLVSSIILVNNLWCLVERLLKTYMTIEIIMNVLYIFDYTYLLQLATSLYILVIWKETSKLYFNLSIFKTSGEWKLNISAIFENSFISSHITVAIWLIRITVFYSVTNSKQICLLLELLSPPPTPTPLSCLINTII